MPTPGAPRRIVMGIDGSAPSRRAVAFVARLAPRASGTVHCVAVLEPTRLPAMPLMPAGLRTQIVGQARALDAERQATARRHLDAAVAKLRAAGWRATAETRAGVPLPALLDAVKSARADTLALGSKGTTGAARMLLGSVAEGALRQSPASVLIVP